jgi:PAS domain S-box-containing protein
LESYQPDVIFIDLVMPNIDGKRLCKIIRSRENLRDVFIIIISGAVSEGEIDIEALGADGFIAKSEFHEMAQNILTVLTQINLAPSRYVSRELFGIKGVDSRAITTELLSAKRHFEIILETMSEGILEISSGGKIVYANPAALSLFNISEENLLGAHMGDVFPEDIRKRVDDLIRSTGSGETVTTEDSPLKINDHQIAINILPIKEGSTSIAILNDVTGRKADQGQDPDGQSELEKELKERTAELEEARDQLNQEIGRRKLAEDEVKRLVRVLKNAISEFNVLNISS